MPEDMQDEEDLDIEVREERRMPFVTVSYERKVQPKKYESATLEATVGAGSINIEDEESLREAVADRAEIAISEIHRKLEKHLGVKVTPKSRKEVIEEAEKAFSDEESNERETQSMEDIIKEVEEEDG